MNDQQTKEQCSGARYQQIRAALDQHWAASDANDFETEHCIYHEDAVPRRLGVCGGTAPGGPLQSTFEVERKNSFGASAISGRFDFRSVVDIADSRVRSFE